METSLPEPQGGPPGETGTARAIQALCARLASMAAWAAALFLVFWFFQTVKMILLGLLAASCLASALRPLMRKLPGPRGLKGVLVGIVPPLLLAGLLALAGWLLAQPIQSQLGQWPQMERQINGALAHWSKQAGLAQQVQVKDLLAHLGGGSQGTGGRHLLSLTTSTISRLLIILAFIFIGAIYILIEPPELLRQPILRMLPPRSRLRVQGALDDLGLRLRWWLIGTVITMVVIGVTAWLGFWLVGLNFIFPLALLAGLSEIVPTIGPLLTFLVVLVFAAAQGWGKVLGVTLVFGVIHVLESYILVPYVMKRTVKIPPLATLFTVILWGETLGPAGLLLAIPIDLALWTFAEHLLAKRWEQERLG